MEILYILLVLLLATRLCGELAVRLGQPALVGELLAGVLLGTVASRHAEALPVLAHLPENEVFAAITELGIFFLMLLAGAELRPKRLVDASSRSVGVALGGLLLPLALGLAIGWTMLPEGDLRGPRALFLGVALAITAVPVSVGVLISLGRLKTAVGRMIVAAAIVDDVLSLVLLALLTAVLETGSAPDAAALLSILGNVTLFFALAVPFGLFVMPWIARRLARLQAEEFEFSFLLVAGLALSVLAEALSMHFLIGAFLAGLFFNRQTAGEDVYEDVFGKISGLTTGFFAPVFFASIGLHLDARAVVDAPLLLVALIVAATIGKVVGSGLPARLSGLDMPDSLAVGMGMNARGAVELIVADVALGAGLFEVASGAGPSPIVDSLYSAVVITAIVTTLATPIALQLWARSKPSDGNDGNTEDAEGDDP